MQRQAFHGKKSVKRWAMQRTKKAENSGWFSPGKYIVWRNENGNIQCNPTGCLIQEKPDIYASEYSSITGIPGWLVSILEFLFEMHGSIDEDAGKKLPHRFLSSIPVGFTNWEAVWDGFGHDFMHDIEGQLGYVTSRKLEAKIYKNSKERDADMEEYSRLFDELESIQARDALVSDIISFMSNDKFLDIYDTFVSGWTERLLSTVKNLGTKNQ